MKAGIIGGAGYAAGELISLLSRHPEVEIAFVTSKSQAGKSVREFHTDRGIPAELNFEIEHHFEIDVLFLCGGHGYSKTFFLENTIPAHITVIDLSTDFRTDESFLYGLPEINGKKTSNRIANPGCFATAIQLALLPVLEHVNGQVHINAITGSTGAGQALTETGHFSWRSSNVSSYKVFEHQHLVEIENTFSGRNASITELNFVPLRGPFTRGIYCTSYFDTELNQKEVTEMYHDFYYGTAFTKIASGVDLKQVVQTNFCLVEPKVIKNKLVVTSVIDNLLKGAAGQAVQNMNLQFGFPEEMTLNLKPGGY